MLYHPGVLPGSTVEDTEAARTWVGLGAGRIITPIKCERGCGSGAAGEWLEGLDFLCSPWLR